MTLVPSEHAIVFVPLPLSVTEQDEPSTPSETIAELPSSHAMVEVPSPLFVTEHDDPSLTVRHVDGRDPLRVVLGHAPAGAKVHPCLEMTGDLGEVLDDLGARDVLQVLVEGGAGVAGAFHRAGLVDRYVVYLAPALFGGDDAPGLFSGVGAATMSDVWRGRITRVTPLGDDIRVDLKPLEPH